MTVQRNAASYQEHQRPRGRQYRVVEEENTPPLEEEEIQLRELKNGVFCDIKRTYLYDRVVIEREDGGQEIKYSRRRLQFSGMPRLLSVYTTEKRGNKSRDEETFYKVEFSLREDIAPETFTEREVNAGEWLAHWPGLAITSRKDKDFYGDILKAQVVPFRLPVGRAKSETGWHQDGVSKLWTYAFRDGRLLTREPELSNPQIPIAGYNFSSSTHGRAWQERMQQAPGQARPADVNKLFSWLETVDAAGRQALLCFGAYRSLIDTIERVGMAIIIAAADDLEARDGSAGAGKTTSIDFARGVDGPCPYRSAPECSFRGTLAGIETRIAHTHDVPISVADFHLPETPTESEFSKWAATVDALVSSAADNAEIKERSTKTLEARRGATIGGLLVMDGEKLHPLLLSRLRRVAILFFRRGEINAEEMHTLWDEMQPIHTSIGHSILRATLGALNKDESAFRRKVRAMEADYEQQLLLQFTDGHASFDKQIARSLAHNFARFVTGARLVETATGASGLVVSALALAAKHMQAQAHLLENGGPSTVTREWILKTTRMLLDESRAHALAMDNDELDHTEHGILQPWGYRRTGLVDRPWAANGPHLLNLSEDGHVCYFKSTLWQELLKACAGRERLKWTYTERTFPDALVKLEIVTPEYDKHGQRTKSAQRVYIAGKRERRLALVARLLDIDSEDEETPPGPPEGQGQADHQGSGPAAAAPITTEPPRMDSQAAARALLDEMTAQECSLRYNQERNSWGITVPDEWTDEEYNALAARVLALSSELYQLLSPGQGQADHQGSGPAAAGNTEPGQADHPESRGPAGQEHTTEGQGARRFGVVFADIRAGQAITEDGQRFSFPENCSLSVFLDVATAAAGQVNRVYVCGPRPGQGESAQAYISWLMDADMMQAYTTSKLGHFFDVNKPDMCVARYQTRSGHAALDIRRINAWLGDDRDDAGQELYSIEDARAALALLTKNIRQHFPLFKNLSGTPSTTFKYLWQQGNHIAKKQFPPLPAEIRKLIHENAGQGRIEYFAENCKGRIPGAYYYDGIFMYAALDWSLPTEIASHDTEPVYAGKAPARYRIRYTVPGDWQHIGPFMTKRAGADWRDKDGWLYPGIHHQGQEFETWVDGSELDVLIQHYAAPITTEPGVTKQEIAAAKSEVYRQGQERAFAAWRIEIRERIVFKPESESRVNKPLETITRKMIAIRERLDADRKQDASRARVYDLARGAARNILLHGIGSFNREGKKRTYLLLPEETPPVQLSRAAEYTTLDDGRQLIIVPEETEADDMMHPEWAALVWARCRARVTRQALTVPYTDLITIRTDAIAVKSRQGALEGGVKVGQFRRKWAIEKTLAGPASPDKFDMLQHKVLGK